MPDLGDALNLTLEQSFQLKLMRDGIEDLTVEELQNALLETTRQLMIKNNVLIQVLKGAHPHE